MSKSKTWGLMFGDVSAFYVSLILTLIIRYGADFSLSLENHINVFSLVLILWVGVFQIVGLYDGRNLKNGVVFFKILVTSIVVNFLVALSFFYLVPFWGISPRTNLFIFIFVFGFIFSLWRYYFNRFTRAGSLQKILIVGNSEEVKDAVEYLGDNPQFGYEIASWFKEGAKDSKWETIDEIIESEGISLIVIPTNLKKNSLVTKHLFGLLSLDVSIVEFTNFYEEVFWKTPIAELEEVWFLENLAKKDKVYSTTKGFLEFVIAVFMAIVLLPVFVVVFLLVKLTSSGPAIYAQTRIGRGGRSFTLYKFRTMKIDAEKDGPKWAAEKDPRCTPIGRFLRGTHIDEIPQLFNILGGGLSFVGPRPERPEFVGELKKEIPYYNVRHLMKPGLTGWAQINYRYGSSFKDSYEKLQYDLYYIKRRSMAFDLLIILKTVKLVFTKAE